ncbi:hypothetical protein BJ546DRAFT_207791 [Cryomyces antarcticus]
MPSTGIRAFGASAPSNKFPKFTDGDTRIVISSSKQYHLHSSILRMHSTSFAAALVPENAAALSKKAEKEGINTRFHLELDQESDPTTGQRALILVALDDHARPLHHSNLLPNVENGRVPDPVYGHYDTVLRALYNQPPTPNETDIGAILREAMGLIEVAENLSCVSVIAPAVGIALTNQGQTFYKAIATNPIAWINLSARINCKAIFKEALINIVGRYDVISKGPQYNTMTPKILELVTRKHQELVKMCRSAESRMHGHYPRHVMRNEGQDCGRASYSNDILSWMALCAFRHWLGQIINYDKNFRGADGGYELYNSISMGGNAYLTCAVMENFHSKFHMSRKCQGVLENHLNFLKEDLKQFAEPLMKCNLQVDRNSFEVKWLACTEVRPTDYPWMASALEGTAAGAGECSEEVCGEEVEEEEDVSD